ncbi:MAG: hypothetical protein ABSC25_24340 [Roseiarcus sp.]|jgi:hypothetical protein
MIEVCIPHAPTKTAAPPPPLDASARALISKAFAAKGARGRSSQADFVKRLEALPSAERAQALMTLAMAARVAATHA